jgi:hypothetical protein
LEGKGEKKGGMREEGKEKKKGDHAPRHTTYHTRPRPAPRGERWTTRRRGVQAPWYLLSSFLSLCSFLDYSEPDITSYRIVSYRVVSCQLLFLLSTIHDPQPEMERNKRQRRQKTPSTPQSHPHTPPRLIRSVSPPDPRCGGYGAPHVKWAGEQGGLGIASGLFFLRLGGWWLGCDGWGGREDRGGREGGVRAVGWWVGVDGG